MMRFKQRVAFAVLILASVAANAQAPATDGTSSASAAPPAEAPRATRREQTAAAVTPDLVVDVNTLAARAAEPVICREVLKQGSNVHVVYCLTRADWRRYRRAEADEAEDLTRALQSGSYSTIFR